jgi:DNA-directed RNA polymerase beta' subunit
MQVKLSELTDEIIRILADKKGVMRSTISGRTSFSERSVIVPDPKLKMDEVILPYTGLVLLMEQIIVNILQSSYNITYAHAYKIWYYSTLQLDERVLSILNNLINLDKIHVLINRNPTIQYQSIVWKRVVGVNTDSPVMSLDPYVLTDLCADFDGDTLNIKLLLNREFDKAMENAYNPRHCFCISRDDGMFNKSVGLFKDIVINIESFQHYGRQKYSQDRLERIKALKAKYA